MYASGRRCYRAFICVNSSSQRPSLCSVRFCFLTLCCFRLTVLLPQVFSISVPYVAMTEILAQHANQLSLVKDQPVRVLDCHRDDWWLVQTIPDNLDNRTQSGGGPGQNGTQPAGPNGMEPAGQNEIFSAEGWVPATLLQPSHSK